MAKYNLEAKYFLFEKLPGINDGLQEELWQLYIQICKFWQTTDHPERMKSDLFVFINNRIEIDNRYNFYYQVYTEVIAELKAKYGDEQAYVQLFTDPQGNITPPTTLLAYVKQFVVNEFISLNLSLGGFKTFGYANVPDGMPLNYPGYIGGINNLKNPPYRSKK